MFCLHRFLKSHQFSTVVITVPQKNTSWWSLFGRMIILPDTERTSLQDPSFRNPPKIPLVSFDFWLLKWKIPTHTHLTKMHPLKFNISSWKIMIGILFSLWWYFFLEGGSCSISGVYLCFTRCTVAGHSGRPAIQTSIQNPPKLRFDMTGTPLTRYLKRHIGPNNLARKTPFSVHLNGYHPEHRG